MGKAAELWFRIGSYALFMLRSRNTMGYGIHSPYLFYIARAILPETAAYYCFKDVEGIREELLRNKTEVSVEDFGVGGVGKRQVAKVAKVALKSQKEAKSILLLLD